MRRKGVVFFEVAVFLLVALATGAQSATSILDRTLSVYEKANGLRAAFTMQIRSEAQHVTEHSNGTLDMRNDKFVLETSDLSVWFDGTTQWTYVKSSGEVNITHPEEEDLSAINPISLLRAYKKGFTPLYKGESTAFTGKTTQDIELVPKKKGDLLLVALQIEKTSGLPVSIRISTKNSISSTIHIHKMETGINQSDRFFVFNENDFPDAEVIDLR